MIIDEDSKDDGYELFRGDDIRVASTSRIRETVESPQLPAVSTPADGTSMTEQIAAIHRASVDKPVVPDPPKDVNWDLMLMRYLSDGIDWTTDAEYSMFHEGKPDKDFFEGTATRSISNADTVLKPISVEIMASKKGRIPRRPVWSQMLEERLEKMGIFLSGTKIVKSRDLNLLTKIFHVHWRFFVFIVLSGGDTSSDSGYGQTIMGYHYFAMDVNTAINNKCF